jgi:PAS domain S-box-containing protein
MTVVDRDLGVPSADPDTRISKAPEQADAGVPEQEQGYRQLLNSLGVAIYTTDAQGRITFYNDAAAKFWGRRPELGELWCGSLRMFWPDGRPMPHAECPMAVALRKQKAMRGQEAVAERPDGSRVSFVPYPTPLRNGAGKVVGAVNVLVDVTERRLAEETLRATAHALSVSNSVKDEFLGLVSHELRTPVTTIFGNAQLLRDRGSRLSEHDRASMLTDIADDSERLRGIVENLLLMTRLGGGAQVEPEPQILVQVLREAIASYAARHPERVIALRSAARQVIVEIDRTYLELLVENLLSNADKYSPPAAEVEVVVETKAERARVRVLDRGIGIPEAEAHKVFSPFYRTDGARTQDNGVGIGLAVCKLVVEARGGHIWASPRSGGGSEIGFELPLTSEVEATEH